MFAFPSLFLHICSSSASMCCLRITSSFLLPRLIITFFFLLYWIVYWLLWLTSLIPSLLMWTCFYVHVDLLSYVRRILRLSRVCARAFSGSCMLSIACCLIVWYMNLAWECGLFVFLYVSFRSCCGVLEAYRYGLGIWFYLIARVHYGWSFSYFKNSVFDDSVPPGIFRKWYRLPGRLPCFSFLLLHNSMSLHWRGMH